MKGHTGGIYDLTKLKNGLLASCSNDKTIRLWDTDTLQQVQLLKGHTNEVTTIKELPENILVSGSYDQTIKLWNLNNGYVSTTIDIGDDVESLIPINKVELAVGCKGGDIKVYDLTTKKKTFTLEGHTSYVNDLILTEDKITLFSGSSDKTIRAWSLGNKECIWTVNRVGMRLFEFTWKSTCKIFGYTGTLRYIAIRPI